MQQTWQFYMFLAVKEVKNEKYLTGYI